MGFIATLRENTEANSAVISSNSISKMVTTSMLVVGLALPQIYRDQINSMLEDLIPDVKYRNYLWPLFVAWIMVLGGNLIYSGIYSLKHPMFERYKISSQKWPWESQPAKYKQRYWKAVLLVAFNNVILAGVVNFAFIFGFGLYTPTIKNIGVLGYLGRLLFMVLCEDIHFYFAHKLLHHPYLYKKVHKIHHEFVNTVAISAEYAHPVEFIFGNLSPTSLGHNLLAFAGCSDLLTFLVFLIFRIIETTESHGGYEFPWSLTRFLPFSCSADYHDYHHRKFNWNYGSFTLFWDTLFGTNKAYFDDMKQKKKH